MTFVEACQNYIASPKEVKISTYLYKALDYTVIDYLSELITPAKKIPAGVQVKCEWVTDTRDYGSPHRKNGKEIFRHHKCKNISMNMGGLSPDQRKVLDLCYSQDCSIAFIAKFFGISERTVNRIKQKALEVLKENNSHIHIRQAKGKEQTDIAEEEKDTSSTKLHLSDPTRLNTT